MPNLLSGSARPVYIDNIWHRKNRWSLVAFSEFKFRLKLVSKETLQKVGYGNVRRYQLGIPIWRALSGLTEIEPEGIRYVASRDQTAVFIDVRDSEAFQAGTLAQAVNIPASLVGPGSGGQEIKDKEDEKRAASLQSATPTKADNPSHKEDFNSLLTSVATEKQSDD